MSETSLTPTGKSSLQTFIAANSLWIFITLTVLLTVVVILLPLPVLAGPALVVFIPTILAALLIRVSDGKGQVRSQLFAARRWRTSLKWIAISLGLAVGLRLLVSLLGLVFAPGYQIQPGMVTPLLLITLIFAAGEEIGWRGYALPRMLKLGNSPLASALLLGIPWALLHLPLTLPGKLAEGVPPLAQFLTMLGLSVLTAWLYLAPKGSILAPVLLHGGQNAAVILNDGLPLALNNWLMALVYGVIALLIILFTRGRLGYAGEDTAG